MNLFAQPEGVSSVETLETVQTEEITYKRKKSNHKGRQLLNQCGHLEVEEIILDIDDKTGLEHMGFIETRKLAITSSKLYVKKYIRHRYINKITDEIKIADPTTELIEKCEADLSLLRHVTVSKFVDHQPEYRIQQIFKRHGVDIPSSTMNNWTHRIASQVLPVVDHIKHQIINSSYMQMDESRIRVMSSKKQGTHQGYVWVMSSPAKKYIYFEYHSRRSREGPKEILSQYKGKFQSGGYSVYQQIEERNENINH